MTEPLRTFSTPTAFRHALEDRVKAAAKSAGRADASRNRQLLLADRLLARLRIEFGEKVITKGGVALGLRLTEKARATRDLDLLIAGPPTTLLERLQSASSLNLHDQLEFTISRAPEDKGTIENDGLAYEGFRFRVTPMLGGKTYGDRFGLDVVLGPVPKQGVEEVEGGAMLSFVGIPAHRHRLLPRTLHIAEKLHAYTQPRPSPNTRVKDLPDLVLLAHTGEFDAEGLRSVLHDLFAERGTHALPDSLPLPPSALWVEAYARMARVNLLPWTSLEEVFATASAFLNPVLDGSQGRWDAGSWMWNSS